MLRLLTTLLAGVCGVSVSVAWAYTIFLKEPKLTTVGIGLSMIDSPTFAAYDKLGAIEGSWLKEDGSLRWSTGWRGQLEGFEFKTFPASELPVVEFPFGLRLVECDVSDADLHRLSHLKKLVLLELDQLFDPPSQLHITDGRLHILREIGLLHALRNVEGISEYTRPQNTAEVTRLNFQDTAITDAGLKELALFVNAKWLNLSGTKVTASGLKEVAAFKNLEHLRLSKEQINEDVRQVLREINMLGCLDELKEDAPSQP